jgi:demethylmenaquinone methyltransferase/2-methoxy-6-polyprenyl-1,4-benzoquinol methylase
MSITPYKDSDKEKKEQVSEMFDNISAKYDFLNRLLSMRIDVLWRKVVIKRVLAHNPDHLLDIATGTADLAIAAHKAGVPKVTGLDISQGMLDQGSVKVQRIGYHKHIHLVLGDSEALPYEDNSIPAITCAFGVRNFQDLELGLSEMYRVLKPGGKVFILEFSKPTNKLFAGLFRFYFLNILPAVGKMVSKDVRAYTYLPESVDAFPSGHDFLQVLNKCGFKNELWKPLTFGISSLYEGTKPS